MKNNDLLNQLDRQIKALENQIGRGVFYSIKDFVEFIFQNEELLGIANSIEEKSEKNRIGIEALEGEAMELLRSAKKRVAAFIKKNKKLSKDEELKGLLEKLEKYDWEIISTSQSGGISEDFFEELEDILEKIGEIIGMDSLKNTLGKNNLYPLDTLRKKQEKELIRRKKEQSELWFSWEKIKAVHYVCTDLSINAREEVEKLGKFKTIPFEIAKFKAFWSMAENGKLSKEKINQTTQEYKGDTFRVYGYISSRLPEQLEMEITDEKNLDKKQRVKKFDKNLSVLTIGKEEIEIKKFGNQYQLLLVMFERHEGEGLGKEWFFSEIAEFFDEAKKPKDKTIYNAANNLRTKIAAEAGIKGFFITTNQTVRINGIYLP